MKVLLSDQAIQRAVRSSNAGLFLTVNLSAFMQVYRLPSKEAQCLILMRIAYQGWYGLEEVTDVAVS